MYAIVPRIAHRRRAVAGTMGGVGPQSEPVSLNDFGMRALWHEIRFVVLLSLAAGLLLYILDLEDGHGWWVAVGVAAATWPSTWVLLESMRRGVVRNSTMFGRVLVVALVWGVGALAGMYAVSLVLW